MVGRTSAVSSRGLDMTLDHETGELDGVVLQGEHAGRRLSALSLAELIGLAENFRDDQESLRLLESYLDRAHPSWRDDVQADADQRQGASTGTGSVSLQEAYKVLGLEQGAGEAEVREAHRRLMKGVHPDRGGSAALAAQINEAKDRILGQHR
jgi:DnaJ-domain-containing protein 1